MLLSILLLLLVASSLAEPSCGELGSGFSPSRSRRAIIGGETVKAQDVPWVVRVDASGGLGTGTLISDRFVITAAHAFPHAHLVGCQKKSFAARIGDYVCLQEDTVYGECSKDRRVRVKRVHILEDSMSVNCSRLVDVAVIELERSIPSAPAICLPSPPFEPSYEKNGKSGEVHLVGYSPIGNNEYLQRGTTNAILKGIFLVSSHNPSVAAVYPGDSGGPMFEIHNGTAVLVGVNVGYGSGIQHSVEVKQQLEKILAAMQE